MPRASGIMRSVENVNIVAVAVWMDGWMDGAQDLFFSSFFRGWLELQGNETVPKLSSQLRLKWSEVIGQSQIG